MSLVLDSHRYIPPGPDDSRSPCPALNALANHSYIPHSGRKLTIAVLVKAIQHVYNFSAPLAYVFAITGVLLCGNGRAVDLEMLAMHNRIEHDASLSRQDFLKCPRFQKFRFYAPTAADHCLVDQLLRQSPDGLCLTLHDFARARVLREAAVIGRPLNPLHAEFARGEVSLILGVFGGDSGRVAVEILRSWLLDGKLPDDWKRPKKVVGLLRTVVMSRHVAAAVGDLKKSDSK